MAAKPMKTLELHYLMIMLLYFIADVKINVDNVPLCNCQEDPYRAAMSDDRVSSWHFFLIKCVMFCI